MAKDVVDNSPAHKKAIPTVGDVRAAAARIEGRVLRTPLVRAEKLSALTGADIWLKLENLHIQAHSNNGVRSTNFCHCQKRNKNAA